MDKNYKTNYLDYEIRHPLVPNSIFYVPDFIDIDEEQFLIDRVVQAPKPKWQHLRNRSLQVYGGYPCKEGMIAESLPKWFQVYTKRLELMEIFDGYQPNQVLINRYDPGQGIMAHEDGPLYYPTVATLNTGSHTVLNFYEKLFSDLEKDFKDDLNSSLPSHRRYRFSLLLWPRSLSILKHDAYKIYLHEIEELNSDDIYETTLLDSITTAYTSKRKIVNIDQIKDKLMIKAKTKIQNQDGSSEHFLRLPRSTRYSFTIRFVPKFHRLDVNKIIFRK